MVKVLVKRLNPNVQLPSYKTEGSSGMDLMAFVQNTIKIAPQSSELIPTGFLILSVSTIEQTRFPQSTLVAVPKGK